MTKAKPDKEIVSADDIAMALVREHERMRTALRAIAEVCARPGSALTGRHQDIATVKTLAEVGLGPPLRPLVVAVNLNL